tara:strand:- start:443 stop:667 length:225 start_codon:yes stop_codon:yes gene_type:complete
MEVTMKRTQKRSLNKLRGLNSELLRDHVNITTIHKKHKFNLMIAKYICIAGLLLCCGYLMGCVYLDWAGLNDSN